MSLSEVKQFLIWVLRNMVIITGKWISRSIFWDEHVRLQAHIVKGNTVFIARTDNTGLASPSAVYYMYVLQGTCACEPRKYSYLRISIVPSSGWSSVIRSFHCTNLPWCFHFHACRNLAACMHAVIMRAISIILFIACRQFWHGAYNVSVFYGVAQTF